MIKEINNYHSFYKKHIQTEEYKQYEKQASEWRINEYEIIKFDDERLNVVVFSDILTNQDITILLSRVYSLDKKKYLCKHTCKKPRLFKKYNYVHLENGYKSYGAFEDVIFVNDKYISKIEVLKTQINNFYAFLEYRIFFKKSLNDEDIEEFVDSNIGLLTKNDFYCSYTIRKDISISFIDFEDYIWNRFRDICQHYITSLFYSVYGKTYTLPCLFFFNCKNKLDLSVMATEYSYHSFYNVKENYIIFRGISRYSYYLYSQDSKVPSFSLCKLIMDYGIPFYYLFNGEYEVNLLNCEFSKYTANEKSVPVKSMIKYLNRIQGLSDEKDNLKEFKEAFNKNWKLYFGNKIRKPSFSIDSYINIFEKSFNYFKTSNDFYVSRNNKIITITALIVSFVSCLVSLISLFTSLIK